jgi:hypothetical protein
MDTQFPSMKASELSPIAKEFATNLIARLESVNLQYGTAVLERETAEPILKYQIPKLGPEVPETPLTPASEIFPDLSPRAARQIFEQLFFAYMASRYVIVPD